MTKTVSIHEMSAMSRPAANKNMFVENAGFINQALNDHLSKRKIYLYLKARCGFSMSYSWFLRLFKRLLPLIEKRRFSSAEGSSVSSCAPAAAEEGMRS